MTYSTDQDSFIVLSNDAKAKLLESCGLGSSEGSVSKLLAASKRLVCDECLSHLQSDNISMQLCPLCLPHGCYAYLVTEAVVGLTESTDMHQGFQQL